MLLAVNIGNTRVALGFFERPAPGVVPLPVRAVSSPLPCAGRFHPGFAAPGPVDAAVVASVNPDADAGVIQWVRSEFGVEARRFPADLPAAIENACERPASVGADRLANAVAAHAELGTACVIVDAGTAITVDAVSSDGTFRGGAILPGIHMAFRALAEGTALLPQVAGTEVPVPIGTSTEAAISSGVLRGIAGAVDRLVADIADELSGCGYVFATGGDAAQLARLCRTKMDLRPHLTLSGLAIAAFAPSIP